MEAKHLLDLLRRYKAGALDESGVMAELRDLPFRDLGFAKLDTHRSLRKGFPEVIYGPGKTLEQIVAIADAMVERGARVLVTRTTRAVFEALKARHHLARFSAEASAVVIAEQPVPADGKGEVVILSAGTSDVPIAEEAAVTLEVMGNRIARGYDVGVAGLHRLTAVRAELERARCVVVAAGMEGALPSVVAGLVSAPVVAVPTSVGYGANFGGLTALCAMLTACASGVVVVNIDNGFGAGYAASLINHQ